MPTADPRALLRSMFDAAVAAAQPDRVIPAFLSQIQTNRLIVVGAGKASAAMARAVEDAWQGELSGLVVTRYGYGVPCSEVEIIEASHPVPDDASLRAAQRIRDVVAGAGEGDTVLALISGGGSSLLALPGPGLTLEDKQAVNRELLRSGATISEMNCVRRHLSDIKGGKLAALVHPAKLVTLLISDVPGDDPADIASGPTVADATTSADALDIVDRYRVDLPPSVRSVLENGTCETVKPGDPRLIDQEVHMVAAPQASLEAAAGIARAAGFDVHILGDAIQGEARDVGTCLAGLARQVLAREQPFRTPCVLLSGGETTVTVRGDGRGGRNVEFLLAHTIALDGAPGIWALACDTDGVDGAEEIAGAIATPDTLERAWSLGMPPKSALARNDGHGFFQALGDSVVSGPTLTNVNDFRAVIIWPS